MPRSPAIVSIGSPGTSRIRKNASSVIPRKVGITMPIRVSAKRTMGGRGRRSPLPEIRSLLDINAVESVPPKRAQLEVDHLLAHRRQLHRMGDGEPGGLFLEDGLCLAVELGAFGLPAHRLCLHDQFLERRVTKLCGVRSIG